MNKKSFLLLAVSLTLLNPIAKADFKKVYSSQKAVDRMREQYFTMGKPEITEKAVSPLELQAIVENLNTGIPENNTGTTPVPTPAPATPTPTTPTPAPTDPGQIDLSQIINIGQQIWKIIVDNKPVVNLSMNHASAVPQGITYWTQMDSWSDPVAKKYEITYKNGFGMTVVDYEFILTYAYNGAVSGVGKYLSEVGFMVTKCNVIWGYTFNANSTVVRTVNVGSHDNPIGGMEINMGWTVDTVFKHGQESQSYYIRGDGSLKEF